MVYEIKKYGEDVLKQIAKEVEINEINDEFRKFLDDMVETMYETDGVGLAAPQIGVSKRIFVCDDGNGVVRKVINPIVVPLTEETQEFEEGCLSVPGIYKKVERPKRVLLKYLRKFFSSCSTAWKWPFRWYFIYWKNFSYGKKAYSQKISKYEKRNKKDERRKWIKDCYGL